MEVLGHEGDIWGKTGRIVRLDVHRHGKRGGYAYDDQLCWANAAVLSVAAADGMRGASSGTSWYGGSSSSGNAASTSSRRTAEDIEAVSA